MERVEQGEIWWANLPRPVGSEAGYRQPVVIVQADELNRSGISTIVVVPTTTNLRWAQAHGNVLLAPEVSGLPEDSVANVSLIHAIDRRALDRRAGKLPDYELQRILAGIDVVLGR